MSEKRSIPNDLKKIKRGCIIIKQLAPGLLEFTLIRSILNAFTPYISIYMLAVIIDELVGNRDLKTLFYYVSLTAGGTLFMNIFTALLSKKIEILDSMFHTEFENYLNNKKLTMDFAKLEDPKITELREKIMSDMFATDGGINAIVRLMESIVENSLSVIIAVIVSFGAITATSAVAISEQSGLVGFVNSIWFAVLLTFALVVCLVLTVRNTKTINKKVFQLYQEGSKNNGYLEYYNNFYLEDDQAGKDVRIFDQRNLIYNEMLTKGRKPWLKIVNGTHKLQQKYIGINLMLSALIGGAIYIFIGLKALTGTISLGSVTSSYAAIIRLVTSVGSLSESLSKIRSNNNYLVLLFEFIDLPNEIQRGEKIPEINNTDWEIEFHNVSFRYPTSDKNALDNLSLKINKNTRTAIVGLNGSGKTTMIKLLCRFYTPDSGYITLNGEDIQKFDYESYSRLFSVVFQDFQLLSFSIGQNVSASKKYNEANVWKSLDLAGIGGRVKEFPTQLEQSIRKNFEEDGVDLSGGEEQKVALARAIYKDAPIVILDEPTAALDPISEFEVYSRFNDLIGRKTSLYVSHRLSSCRFCDSIAVFHNGQIIQFGSHYELIQNTKGKYFELWNAQAQYYADDVNDSLIDSTAIK